MATKISMFTELSSSDRPSWGLCITGSHENGARDPESRAQAQLSEQLSRREVGSRQMVLINSQSHTPPRESASRILWFKEYITKYAEPS